MTHTFTKRIGDQTKQNKKIEGPNQREEIHPTPLPMEVLIKNQNNNSGRLCDTEKKLKEGIISEIEISKVKLNVLLINNI